MKIPLLLLAGLALFAATASAQQITDAQIAAIAVTANQVDIDAGELAQETSSNAEVQAFGRRMVAEHQGVIDAAVALVTKLGVTPEENPTSQSLQEGGDANLAALKELTGAAFDKAYVDHEVVYHEQVLEALDTVLIPGATNAELKALLEGARPAFVQHLEHARHLQGTLAGAH